ncbi:hypothetical protein AXE65_05290 [Ventosimonas gracilis]|uniref:PilY1 beta-propeller domain-containing protein n=2 Tax=Ventosimonas gracilis TaxID=1680762 RepID=A0A139SP56_9GAMM|nr:hypothetical protein AXE65_05290 [Ventosimonas gracilis]
MSLYDAARYLTNAPNKHDAWAIKPNSSPSPITQECQPTHLVMLTDGQANMKVDVSAIENLIGKSCDDRTNASERCAPDIARWMKTTDQSPLPGNQFITTHTIGFALNALGGAAGQQVRKYLQDIATAGGGLHRTADQANDLLSAFQEIISSTLQAQNATMVNSSVPQNIYSASSRREHKPEEYYPLFKPAGSAYWEGNFKKYGLDNSIPPVTIDAKGNPAHDASGAFKSDARSFWSIADDGGEVDKGGAVSILPDNANARRLFVHKGALPPSSSPNGVALDTGHYDLRLGNHYITNKDIGIGVNDSAERKALFDWIRSKKMGDPLHSSPTLFSYGCNGSITGGQCNGTDRQMALIGTNEGFVHLFDTHNGEEQFAFMPGELLGNIKTLKENANITASNEHPYGMDNTVTVWANDINGNGNIDASQGEHVYAYATMRRGGRGLYALDITRPKQPKLLWKIMGGETTGFEKLGYTWSQPQKSKIVDKGQEIDVLIFAGGYHTNDDIPSNYRNTVPYGNDIYIINAKTGQLIWSAQNDLSLSKMKHSIPGKVYVLHSSMSNMATIEKKEYAQSLIFADTGGQIWRLFLKNGEVGNLASDFLVSADDGGPGKEGVIAETSNGRRFYHTPSVVVLRGSQPKLAINIGSGYHARPLNTNVEDRFYSIRVPISPFSTTNLDDDNILLDVTNKLTKAEGEQTAQAISNNQAAGWYIKLTGNGEKVMSSATTQLGSVFFNTYVPGVKSNPCQPASGTNYLYVANLLSGRAVEEIGFTERKMAMTGLTGLPGAPYFVALGGKYYVKVKPGLDGFIEIKGSFDEQGKKTYWIDLQDE